MCRFGGRAPPSHDTTLGARRRRTRRGESGTPRQRHLFTDAQDERTAVRARIATNCLTLLERARPVIELLIRPRCYRGREGMRRGEAAG